MSDCFDSSKHGTGRQWILRGKLKLSITAQPRQLTEEQEWYKNVPAKTVVSLMFDFLLQQSMCNKYGLANS